MGVSGAVVSVQRDGAHRFSKQPCAAITIVAGIGVEGDAHAGAVVKHRSRVVINPAQPNLRQVHLIHVELFAELASRGFALAPGDLGENITTSGVDLLGLGRGTRLQIGPAAVLEVTGLRNPCGQIEAFMPGLLAELAIKRPNGIIRKAGIMTIAVASGTVSAGDPIEVILPAGPHVPLERV